MRRRYTGSEETELWSIEYDLVLDDDGTFMLHKVPRGFAGSVPTTVRGKWEQRDTGVTLFAESPLVLAEHDNLELDLEGARLRPQPIVTRHFIYREDAPPILWAWRLVLEADGTFVVHERVYAGEDGTESEARGDWRQLGDVIAVTASESAIDAFPAGIEIMLYEVVGDAVMLGHRRFEPDRG